MSVRSEVPKGTRFGRLTVVEEIDEYVSPAGHRGRRFLLTCDCGNSKVALLGNLRKPNHTTSCGCYHQEVSSVVGKGNTTHGLSYEPLYAVHGQMVGRCTNPDHHAYENYGGRGISVCEEWAVNPKAYIDWAMSSGWEPGLTIDRIDNNGNYEPGNCRLATKADQNRNKRNISMNFEKAREIREDSRKSSVIAEDYGVTRKAVNDIKAGRSWKEE